MHHRTRTLTALTALLALVVMTSLGLRARAAELEATYTVYLPLVACPGCTGNPTPTPSEDAAEMIRLVNIERAAVGCPAVVADDMLKWSTQNRAVSVNTSHDTSPLDPTKGYYPYGARELIGTSSGSAAQMVAAWMASPEDRATILWCLSPSDPNYLANDSYIVGVGHEGSYWVWTMLNVSAGPFEVIRLVNIERAKVGCPAVVAEPHVMAGVQAWAEYMRAHNIAQHATMAWYAPYGYPTGVMENIGGGGRPAQIVEQWLSSHMGHRENLLWCYPTDDPSYDPNEVYVAGVGHAGTYWVWGLVNLLPEDIPTGPLP